ncbi:MAG: exo-alpha-sialidase [Bacteroidetes bacterium]|nr:exo-alpha-sialidase [Bacteroidota bacterium]MCW5897547.1 exo-alpha-sialidase [Bacteroidota bacterium]
MKHPILSLSFSSLLVLVVSAHATITTITRFPLQDSTRSNTEALPLVLSGQTVMFFWAESTIIRAATSTNGGETWGMPAVVVDRPNRVDNLAGIRTPSGRIILGWHDAGAGNLAITYSDDGVIWSAPNTITTTVTSFVISQTADGTIWASYRPALGGARYIRSTDNGGTWLAPQLLPSNVWENVSFVSLQGSTILSIYTSSTGYLERMVSTDGGASWSSALRLTNRTASETRPRVRKLQDETIVVAYQAKRSDSTHFGYYGYDILYLTSSDGGSTWSSPHYFTRYIGNDRMHNVDLLNDAPLVSFSSSRFARVSLLSSPIQEQLWYGLIDVTPDTLAPPVSVHSEIGHQRADYDNWIRAYVDDETGIASVVTRYSVDSMNYPPLQLFDDGLHWDLLPGDNVWGNVVPALPVGLTEFRLDITDVTGTALPDVLAVSYTSTPGPPVVPGTQGDSMKVAMARNGTFGKTVYPHSSPYLGMQYGVGSNIEHLYGAGLWIGGKKDTSSSGTGQPIRLVSTAYEGWAGPMYEFSPGSSIADTIWQINGRNVPKPAGWDSYWGTSLPFRSIADQNFYCTYTDYFQPVAGHIPLGVKVIQSSFTWNDAGSQGIQILDFKIMNNSERVIDSAYIAFFSDSDVGPVNVPGYETRNFSDYYSGPSLAFAHNPVDAGSTPMGVSILNSVQPLDSLRFTYRWFTGGVSPDEMKYRLLSEGGVMPGGFPGLGDIRFVLSFGPFTIHPYTAANPDTLNVAFALLCAADVSQLNARAIQAAHLYQTVVLDVEERGSPIPNAYALEQNYPNPFNPSTKIKFRIPAAGLTNLKLYDVLGREVGVLVKEHLKAGEYEVLVDGRNLASGIYFYTLRSGSFAATRKAVLLK